MVKYRVHVVYGAESLEERDEVEQLRVARVVEPTRDRDCVVLWDTPETTDLVVYSINLRTSEILVAIGSVTTYRMKDVTSGWVVDDHNTVETPSQFIQILHNTTWAHISVSLKHHDSKILKELRADLHVIPPVEDAGVPEQARPEHSPLVEQVRHRVSVLGQGCCNQQKSTSMLSRL